MKRIINCVELEIGPNANLRLADLRLADLREANLSWADLRGANLSWADLSGANLSWADLREANLRLADLSGANLSGANLRGANLRGANLSGADLSGANLRGANLSEANLPFQYQSTKGLLNQVAEAALASEMNQWHTCATTHCIGGWAVHLHPDGKRLESMLGTKTAAQILIPEACHMFSETNEKAKEFLKQYLPK